MSATHKDPGGAGTIRAGAGTIPAGAGEVSQAILVILRLFRGLECVDAGLTPSQYRIMKLAGAGGERSTRLAQRLAVAKPTLTATADGLVAAGYAVRAAEPGDRRVVRLSLTAAGRAALDRADAAYSAWLGPLLAATGDPATVLDAFGLLDSALAEARRARNDGDGKGQGHGHRPEYPHERDPQPEGGRHRTQGA
ncbi:MAG TPA: MarR family winged helix-turn-helix transcriptional regulator [Streptosporangiaceae bacterium]|nr:MarR family winged helix-turn-helix transcriptional regulator [Streptosporangiaceae bacterium]